MVQRQVGVMCPTLVVQANPLIILLLVVEVAVELEPNKMVMMAIFQTIAVIMAVEEIFTVAMVAQAVATEIVALQEIPLVAAAAAAEEMLPVARAATVV